LVGRQEGHPACKKRVVGCWRGCLSGAWCRLAYGPADATATLSLSLASVKSRLVLPFWYRPTRVVPEKGPLNGCVCVCVECTECTQKLTVSQLEYCIAPKTKDTKKKLFKNHTHFLLSSSAMRRTVI